MPSTTSTVPAASRLRIVFVATECAPWSKVGGLADVVGALPPALAARGHDVLTVVPRYAPYEGVTSTGVSLPLDLPPEMLVPASTLDAAGPALAVEQSSQMEHGQAVDIEMGEVNESSSEEAAVIGLGQMPSGAEVALGADDAFKVQQPLQAHAELYTVWQGGVERVFVDHPLFLSSDIYGGSTGGTKGVYTYSESWEAPDLELRYSILCQAALAAPVLLRQDASGEALQQPIVHQEEQQTKAGVQALQRSLPTVFVANDWPTSLLLLRLRYCLRGDAQAPPLSVGSAAADHTGAVLRLQSLLSERLAGAAAAFCIHNLAYQGLFSAAAFPHLRLPATALRALCTSSDLHAVLRSSYGSSGEGGLAAADPPAKQHGTQQQLERPQGRAGSPVPPDYYLSPTMAAASLPAAAARDGDQRRWRWMRKLRQQGAGGDGAAVDVAEQELEEQQEPALPAHLACESGRISFMQGALLAADALVTVSPGYAAEVQRADSGMGCGLDELIAARGIRGIMNGTDVEEWDPSTDAHLPNDCHYDAHSVAVGKAAAKAALQARLGLSVDPDAPLIAFVGRLTAQKGVDVVLGAAPVLLAAAHAPAPSRWRPGGDAAGEESAAVAAAASAAAGLAEVQVERQLKEETAAAAGGAAPAAAGRAPLPRLQLVLLGTGEPWMEAALDGLARSFPGQAAGLPSFSEELAHWLMAASDFMLVPSRFEPCGLVAQCAVRYGAVPIVTAVGGLRDLVDPSVGYALPPFSLDSNAADQRQNVQALVAAIQEAAAAYGSEEYRRMQAAGMALDVSWTGPAAEWEALLAEAATAAAARAAAVSV